MIDTILVGGEEGRHLERLKAQAESQGINILWHVCGSARRPPSKIPQEARLLVILKSHIGHPMEHAMKDMAKKQGVPFLMVKSAGFASDLAVGLKALKIDPSTYGAGPSSPPPRGTWEWRNDHWDWTPSTAAIPRGESWGAIALAAIAGLALRWRKKRER